MQKMRSFEIAVDSGGTFTDVVCREAGVGIRTLKVPSTRRDPSEAVLDAVRILVDRHGVRPGEIDRFIHGTTVATNAVLERKGARIGLITTAGFRDVLEIGRQMRTQVYQSILQPETPVFLAPGRFRQEVRERISASGEIVIPLDEGSVTQAMERLVETGVQAIAVCLLFSFRNPVHELRIREILAKHLPDMLVSLSHEVDPAFREYERTVVTAFDAYIKPVVDEYLGRLKDRLAQLGVNAPLQVMQSRGGLASAVTARERPVRLFLSGPAAGVVGGNIVGASAAIRNMITIDIGGTSADIALIGENKPMVRSEGIIGGYVVRVPMVDVNTIGSGGGSIVKVDEAGGLRVGPQSAGSEPGPACYGRGGQDPTVTDASLVLGYIDPDYFAGGTFTLDASLAHRAIGALADRLGLRPEDAALGIHRVLNAQMAEGIRLVSVRQGVDPREYALVPLGGAGGIHATSLARELGMSRVLVPRIPGVLAAAGLLAASVEHEISGSFTIPLAEVKTGTLREFLHELDKKAYALMTAEGVSPEEITVSYHADMCYIGQSYFVEIPFDPRSADLVDRLYRDFLTVHDRVYGHSFENPAKIVNLRTVHRARGAEAITEMRFEPKGTDAVIGRRSIHVEGAESQVEAVVYDRDAMRAGDEFMGPAIIQQPDTTTLVEPGWRGNVDEAGNIMLHRIS